MSSDTDELMRRIEALEDMISIVVVAYGDESETKFLRDVLNNMVSAGGTSERSRIFEKARRWSEIRFPSE